MITAVERSEGGNVGFTWYEIFKNGKTTGYQYNALNNEHAITIHTQLK